MPRLVFAIVRHGDYEQLPATPSAHQPFGLNAAGQAQAAAAAEALQQAALQHDWQIDPVVDCSRLLRAWQTARRIADGLNDVRGNAIDLHEFDALAERGLGIAGNLSVDVIEAVLHGDPRYAEPPADWKSNSHYRLPLAGAESLMEAGARVAAHLRWRGMELAGSAYGDTLKIVVGHGAAFRHAAYHLGVLDVEEIATLSMYHATPVYVERLADDRWRHIGGEWRRRRGTTALD